MKRLRSFLAVLCAAVSLSASNGKVAVVLGGGGARGYAEVALLEKLDELGIPVDLIVGTSIGSLIGAMYATGWTPKAIGDYVKSHDLLSTVLQPVSQRRMPYGQALEPRKGNLFTLSYGGGSVGDAPNLSSDNALMALLGNLYGDWLGEEDFDKLPIPLRCVATDAMDGDAIVFDQGSLITAVRSSISIPMVYAPYPLPDGRYAMDGGLVNNVPIEVARQSGADYIIAMDVSPVAPATGEDMQSLLGVAGRLLAMVSPSVEAQYPEADVLIIPALKNDMQTMLAFGDWNGMYTAGKAAVEAHADELEALAEKLKEEGRTLEPRAFERPSEGGSHERTIEDVEVHDILESGEEAPIDLASFDFLYGQPLDEKNRTKLERTLARIRTATRLSMTSYDARNIGEDKQTLVINYGSYAMPSNSFTLTGYGTLGFSNNAMVDNVPEWAQFSLEEDFLFEGVTHSKFDFDVTARQGNSNSITLGVWYPVSLRNSVRIRFGGEAMGGAGSYSLLSHEGKIERNAPIDVSGGVTLAFSLDWADMLRVFFRTSYQSVNVRKGDDLYDLLWAELSLIYDDHVDHGLLEPGFRFDLRGRFGICFPDDLVRENQLQFRHDILLDKANLFGYGFRLFFIDFPEALNMAYGEAGGVSGIPGSRYATLRKNLVMMEMRYRLRLASLKGMPLVFLSRIAMGVMDDHEPFDTQEDDAWFPGGVDYDAGIEAGVGVETPLGNFAATVGYSVDGNFAVMFGLIE